MKRKYTEEEFINAVQSSVSIAEVIRKLGLSKYGATYKTIKRYCQELNLDMSHFTGKLWSKGKQVGPKRDISDYLTNKVKIGSHRFKHRLIKENIFEYKCYQCNLTEWNNQPIPIELHHKDGNNDNNELSNIILLCPNCHAQTDNYRGKAKQYKIHKKENACKESQIKYGPPKPRKPCKKKIKLCPTCNNELKRGKQCMNCYLEDHAKNIPPKEELERLIWTKPTTLLAKDYGVSDSAIGKWCKKYNISKPPRGHWMKNGDKNERV